MSQRDERWFGRQVGGLVNVVLLVGNGFFVAA